ncbi:arginase family protein [Microbacterium halophytorum]|uniref:arginase family protein n=1 Tax=Microbacterium halophytorum TaxID=2067568 RepID=UPI000CFC8347|nr:arginase family protein [Microbacterium halophytorum]
MTRFVVVPQWQGSASSRAMALIDGAEAIAGDLPASACTRVDVPLEAGEAIDTGISRASSLLRIRRESHEHLAPNGEPAVVVGGDAGVAVAAIGALVGAPGASSGRLAVAWFGAHAALRSPNGDRDRAYESMALRAVLGGFDGDLALPAGAVEASDVALAGAREFDDEEEAVLAESGVAHVGPDAEHGPAAAATALDGAERVFVHVSLDVLDPAEISGVADAVPFGMSAQTLVTAIGELRSRYALAGAAITGFAPRNPAAAVDDMGTILRIVSALTKPV